MAAFTCIYFYLIHKVHFKKMDFILKNKKTEKKKALTIVFCLLQFTVFFAISKINQKAY